jgi:hypothetical protein
LSKVMKENPKVELTSTVTDESGDGIQRTD